MDYASLTGTVLAVVLIFSIAMIALSIYMCYWAYKKKGILGLLLALFLGIIGWIIVAFMERDEPERERERERLAK
jgi:uncharacterized membrane protein